MHADFGKEPMLFDSASEAFEGDEDFGCLDKEQGVDDPPNLRGKFVEGAV